MENGMDTIYRIEDTTQLLTPCLLVYPEIIRDNLKEAVRIAGDGSRLRLHVKTHKTAEIVQLATEAGITKHKCATLAEAQMLGECQVADVLIAYPQVGPNIVRLVEVVSQYPLTRFATVVDNQRCATELSDQLMALGLTMDVLIDIDSGMHRTGIAADEGAFELAQHIVGSSNLLFSGLHVYDGQNHQSSLQERTAAVAELLKPVQALVAKLKEAGMNVGKMVCGGTPTFPVFANYAFADVDVFSEAEIELSPGTCVLSDFNYGKNYQDMNGFRHALLLLTRVISKTSPNRLTVDLGYKAVASDQPADRRCFFPELPDAKLAQHSEEHLAIETPHANAIEVGQVLYAVPAHVCPTVALHARMHVVRDGMIHGNWKVAARDRLF
jgi:D-threonine aldolase